MVSTTTLFDPLFIGFDRYVNNIANEHNTYPPYNVVKDDEDAYTVEIAIAGFGKNDLDITENNGVLTVKGEHKENDERQFLHKGVATRKFTRVFNLAEHVRVVDAEIHKGLLQIRLERIIPEDKKPRRIAIES